MSQFKVKTKLLLVEDNPADARLVELLLEEIDNYQYVITKATTLEESFKQLTSHEFDIVLLDLSLPDSNGFDTLKKFLHKHPEANVIVLTGYSDKELGLKAVRTGAQDFLVKGDFDSNLLAKSLRFSIERKAVVKRLAEAQRMAHIGSWTYELNTGKFVASQELCHIFFLKEDSFILHLTQQDKDNTPPHLDILKNIHKEVLIAGYVKKDIVLSLPDGQTKYIFIKCDAIEGHEGKAYLFNGIAQDLTERKLAELETEKSKLLYKQIFNQSSDAICYCALDGTLLDFNKATEIIFDKDADTLKLFKFQDLFLLSNNNNPSLFLDAIANKKSIREMEIKIFDKTGQIRECLMTISAMGLDGAEGYNAIIRDVTEKKQKDILLKAQENAKMKDEFLARISHDMRLPMTVVLGYSNMVLNTSLSPEQSGYLKIVRETSEKLLGIIEDILEISTLQYGEIQFEKQNFNLHELMMSLSTMISYKIIDKQDVMFETSIADDVPQHLIGDAKRLNQILMNLTGNAVKFTDKGHIIVKIIKLDHKENKVRLKFSIEDTGIGIHPDRLDSVFEPFTKVIHKERLYEGTGLGLAIVKNLVEKQGGKIHVTSHPNVGSNFFFELSFEVSPAYSLEQQGAYLPPKVEKNLHYLLNEHEQVRILCAEDHRLLWQISKKLIEKRWTNVTIEFVENGQLAIEALQRQPYHLIMMDMEMPVLNGREATKYIREKFPIPLSQTPIIAVTADANLAKRDRYKEYLLDDYVTKPFVNPEDLFSKIEKYIKPIIQTATAEPLQYINLDYLDMMADGDTDMKRLMIEMLLKEPAEEIEKMKTALREQKYATLKSIAHKMKSTVAFVGNDQLTQTNRLLEQTATTETDNNTLHNLIMQLEKGWQIAVKELKIVLNSL